MKIYDFDAKFFEYARTWMALHPGIKEDQIEDHYNEMMSGWLNAPATWLDGAKPIEYFERYSEPKDLLKLMEEYVKRDIGLPEPLYSRIVSIGESCVPGLMRIAGDSDKNEQLRANAMAMLRDIGSDEPLELYVNLIASAKEEDELAELAADTLSSFTDDSVADALLAKYESASEYAQSLILDVLCNFPGHDGTYELLIGKLLSCHDKIAYYASLIEKFGDPRALDTLQKMIQLSDIGYVDYIELRNAIESLGGDPGEERTFYGDPDYEAMRNV